MPEKPTPSPQNRDVVRRTRARLEDRPGEPIEYQGLPVYVAKAADAAGLDDSELRTKAAAGWHADAVGTALSQIVDQAKDGRLSQMPGELVSETFDRLESVLASLDVQREALAEAIGDVKAIVGEPSRLAKGVDDRKPLRSIRASSGVSGPEQPGAHRVDRPSVVAADAEGSPPPDAVPPPPVLKPKRSKTVSKDKKAETQSEEKNEKPASPGVRETDDAGRPLYPPADIDGDGEKEQIPYPGPHTDPTVPPEAHESDD